MATNLELHKFTNQELRLMSLTNADLAQMSFSDLLALAEFRLKHTEATTPKESALKSALQALLIQITASVVSDALHEIEWKDVLISVISLLKDSMSQ